MYYGIIMVAVTMFSLQFLFNQQFEKQCGSGLRAMLVFSSGYSISGLLVLLIINKFVWEFTWFTLIMAVIATINGMAYTFCSLKAFGKINLSLYSVFAMLGGMMLPFIAGILFFQESLSVGKIICVVLVGISLFLTVRWDKKNSGIWYYIGIFVLNGMSGVISKIFQAGPWEKTSAAGYSILSTAVTALFSLVILLFIKGERLHLNFRATGSMLGYGVLSKVGNFLLLLSLAHLPASTQYPMVTGGVMIISTIICFFTPEKPSKREIGAVLLSFAGMLVLVLNS